MSGLCPNHLGLGMPLKMFQFRQPIVEVRTLFPYGVDAYSLGNRFTHGNLSISAFQCRKPFAWRLCRIVVYFFRVGILNRYPHYSWEGPPVMMFFRQSSPNE